MAYFLLSNISISVYNLYNTIVKESLQAVIDSQGYTSLIDHLSLRPVRSLGMLLALGLLFTVASCGTAHHFMPPRPLEKGQWQISVSWHLNLNDLSHRRSIVLPDVFGHVGLSDEVVLGTGCSFILVPTFLNVAYYDESSPNEYWMYWSKTKLLTGHNNPFLEAGLGYSKTDDGVSRVALLGVGFGLWPPWTGHLEDKSTRLTLNFGLVGKDVGINLAHYPGITKLQLTTEFPIWPPSSDTVLSFASGEVVEIVTLKDRYFDRWGFVLRSGDTLACEGYRPCPDCFSDHELVVNNLAGDSLHYVYFDNDWAIVDFDELKKAAIAGDPVIILRAPQSLVDRINNSGGWQEDSSIGWAVFGWPR